MKRGALPLCLLALGLMAVGSACTRKAAEAPEMTIHLYSGIRNFVRLGDNESDVKRASANMSYVREDIALDPPTATLRAVDVTYLFYYKAIGTKVYFRNGQVVLLEMQEPFRGVILGKTMKFFQFELRQDKTWAEILEREFGGPIARGAGGRFGAEALYYPWGDISFNKMGPNEIALYTDPAISQYRQRSFGREIRLFK
jgi:hypothetical protein